jgi:hypothetical protein
MSKFDWAITLKEILKKKAMETPPEVALFWPSYIMKGGG